jgi:hypothetical protein
MNPELSLEQVELLHRLQTTFEKDPENMKAAYELFRALNSVGKYNTVVRLYTKHDLGVAYTYQQAAGTYKEAMQSQYELALDNMRQFGVNLGGAGADGIEGGKVTPQNLNKILFSK